MEKKKKVFVFIILSIVFILVLSFLPYDILMLEDDLVLTKSEFDKLLNSNSFVLSQEHIVCNTSDTDSELQENCIKYKLFNLFNVKNLKVNVVDDEVFVGGKTLGFSVNTKGVIVVGSNYILTENGKSYPMSTSNLQVGDIIIKVNDTEVVCVQDILDELNIYTSNQELVLEYIREGESYITTMLPALDVQTNTYRLGLWLKENAMGVGTLTYVNYDSKYGALGHAISLDSTGTPLEIMGGTVYNCNVVGTKIGARGQAGQLLGVFNTGENAIGSLDVNSENGAFGEINDIASYSQDMETIKVGGKNTVKPGKATILSCVTGKSVKEYDIEIIKTNYQNSSGNKSMVIRITDPELLSQTGGIVQGMSGSPIIQDGKLVGAVTHVFLNDATKGFGLYIDFMM